MIEKLVAGGVSASAVAVAGTVATDSPYQAIAQWMPTVTGVIFAIIVWTITVMKSTKKNVWTYNILVGLLTSLFTAVVVKEQDMSPYLAMGTGIFAGSMGVGIISFVKPFMHKMLVGGLTELTKLSAPDEPPKPDEPEKPV